MELRAAGVHPNHRVLFEPLKIGPVTAPNRFYQTPYATGYGFRDPAASARFREVRAEGGWGVVSTEQTEIHPSSDMTPYIEGRLWDDSHIADLALTADAVHRHGALAALELSHCGLNIMNAITREEALGPSSLPLTLTFPTLFEPSQCRAMSLEDIGEVRAWHAQAVRRGISAGFDIIYVYASLVLSLPAQFLSTRYNKRTDRYGGSLVNRARLLRELIEDTVDAVQGRCAVATRITLDELLESPLDGRCELEEFFSIVGELPDLWDVVVGGYGNDAGSAQFGSGALPTEVVRRVKGLTTKPVVSVGCFTSPDRMAELLRDGVVDLIGAARPSIADPFLPRKVADGQAGRIVKCIACNLCVASDFSSAPIRCPQNPTAGEELRRSWHPVHIPRTVSPQRCLVVGAGVAGLECARVLTAGGCDVTLREGKDQLGGRVMLESMLPGIDQWRDVIAWRQEALSVQPEARIEMGTQVDADMALSGAYDHIILATGARWRADGVGHACHFPVAADPDSAPLTPDEVYRLMRDKDTKWPGHVTIYDDEHYYTASLIADYLISRNVSVTLVTPAAEAAVWSHKTMEQSFLQSRLMRNGVHIIPHHRLVRIGKAFSRFENVFVGTARSIEHDAIILVTARQPDRTLHDDLARTRPNARLTLIGDASAPGTLAHVTYSAHRAARAIIGAVG